MTILVILNTAIMKSEHVREPTFITSWKSFKEMEGFAFIFAYRAPSTRSLNETLARFRMGMWGHCRNEEQSLYQNCVHTKERLYWGFECQHLNDIVEDKACDFFRELEKLRHQTWQQNDQPRNMKIEYNLEAVATHKEYVGKGEVQTG